MPFVQKLSVKMLGFVKKKAPLFLAGFIFAVLCYLLLAAAMEPVSKSAYCGGKCHEMNTAYNSWELSVHGSNRYGIRVDCIECHLPAQKDFISHTTAKGIAGMKDIYEHNFGGRYDSKKMQQEVLKSFPNTRCIHCHKDLLKRPGSDAARIAHSAVLSQPDEQSSRCVNCHANVGHNRSATLFAPYKQ